MANWINDLRRDRRRIRDRIRGKGQRAIAFEAGMGEMKVSRFMRGDGGNTAEDLYRLASAVGLSVLLVPAGSRVKVDGQLFEELPPS